MNYLETHMIFACLAKLVLTLIISPEYTGGFRKRYHSDRHREITISYRESFYLDVNMEVRAIVSRPIVLRNSLACCESSTSQLPGQPNVQSLPRSHRALLYTKIFLRRRLRRNEMPNFPIGLFSSLRPSTGLAYVVVKSHRITCARQRRK